jgi:hypothetical protein
VTPIDGHCGKAWPHKPHEWLPDYPHALWESCPGSPEPEKPEPQDAREAPQEEGT